LAKKRKTDAILRQQTKKTPDHVGRGLFKSVSSLSLRVEVIPRYLELRPLELRPPEPRLLELRPPEPRLLELPLLELCLPEPPRHPSCQPNHQLHPG